MASAGWWACSFSVPVLLGVSIRGSSFGPDSFLCLISGHLVRGVEWVTRNPQTENVTLVSRGRFLFLRMTSKTVGCCDVRVFLRLRELTGGGSLPLAVRKFVDTDAAGVQGRV